MADLPFKINIETESGKEVSYFTQSLALTTEASISSSVILARINLLESSSYSHDAIISETGRSGSIQAGVTGQTMVGANGSTTIGVYPLGYNPTGSGMPATDGRFTFIDSDGDRQVLGYTGLTTNSYGWWYFNNLTGWRGTGNSIYMGSYNGWGGPDFSGSANLWLSASLDGTGLQYGSITFHHTDGGVENTVHSTDDTADRLKRYRFWGTKVCNVLGFPEGQWQYPVNFNLDDSGEGVNFFSGNVSANTLSVARDVSFSPLSKVTSNIRFDINETADLFVLFTSGSAAFQQSRLWMGWNTDTERFEIDGGIQLGDRTGLIGQERSYCRFGEGAFNQVSTGEIDGGGNINIKCSDGVSITGSQGPPSHQGSAPHIRFGSGIYKATPWGAGSGYSLTGPALAIGEGANYWGGNIQPLSGSVFEIGDWHGSGDDRATTALHLWPTGDLVSGWDNNQGSDNFQVHMDLAVSGSAEITSGTRAYFDGGESTAFSADRYLDFNNGTQMTSDGLGYRMHRPGSITGVSAQFNVTVCPGVAFANIEVHKNGSSVFSKTLGFDDETGINGGTATQARGIDRFIVGDVLTLYVNITNTITVDDYCAFVEVTYDS